MSGRTRGIVAAVAVAALLVFYLALVGQRALALLGTGSAAGIGLGAAIAVIPVLTVWFLVREVSQARAVDRLTARLAAEGGLDLDELPRSPGGRIDREAARAEFERVRDDVASAEPDWRGWYRLGWAYDAAGDRRRARAALRTAVRLARAEDSGGELD